MQAATSTKPGMGDEQSHNLLGQRLGRKGRNTRERILAALQALLAGPTEVPLSLTAVAREASIGMTTLYIYFADLPELLLAALEPLQAEANLLQERFDCPWPDETLESECHAFLKAHYMFWARNSRILHLRNSIADNGDERMLASRRAMSHPVMMCLTRQIGLKASQGSPPSSHAVVLTTMLERMATITTDENISLALTPSEGGSRAQFAEEILRAEARIMALTIRDQR